MLKIHIIQSIEPYKVSLNFGCAKIKFLLFYLIGEKIPKYKKEERTLDYLHNNDNKVFDY